jgi:hypothetical protein
MWIRVATNKEDVHKEQNSGYTYVEGSNVKEYYFDDYIAELLEQDGFLTEMWNKFNALFDWGDCDYFLPQKCILFKEWLENRLNKPISNDLKHVYEIMLNLTNLAIQCNTGISFDF